MRRSESGWSVEVGLDREEWRALQGWHWLARGRTSNGWSPDPLPPPWIEDWIDREGIEDPEQRDDYRVWIRMLDEAELEHMAREAKLERELAEAKRAR